MRAWAVVETAAPLQELELPTPEPQGTEVLLETVYCGVCHSDIHIWEGRYDLGGGRVMNLQDRGLTLPLAMGHEVVGRVVKRGPDATGVQPGDVRIVYPWVGCDACPACAGGNDNMCTAPRFIGVFRHGGYATHVLAPHPRMLVDPGTIDPALAATYACSGISVLSAIRKVLPLPPDEPVALVGAGGLGLQAIAVLKALGHRAIVSVDISAEKRAAAGRAGATGTVDGAGGQVAEAIVAACGVQPVAVIDLVNGTATARFAFEALRKGGKLVQVGLFGGELTLPLPLMPIRALTIQGSYVGTLKDLRDLVAMGQHGGLEAVPVGIVPQSQAYDALMRLRDGRVTGRLVLKAELA